MSTAAPAATAAPEVTALTATRAPSVSFKFMIHNGKQYLVSASKKGLQGEIGVGLNPAQWERLVPTIQRIMASSHEHHEIHPNNTPNLEQHAFSIELSARPTVKVNINGKEIKFETSRLNNVPSGIQGQPNHDLPLTQDLENAVFTIQPQASTCINEEELRQLREEQLPRLNDNEKGLHMLSKVFQGKPHKLAATTLDETLKLIDPESNDRTILPTITNLNQSQAAVTTLFQASAADTTKQRIIIPVLIPRKDQPSYYAAFCVDKVSQTLTFYDPFGREPDNALTTLSDSICTSFNILNDLQHKEYVVKPRYTPKKQDIMRDTARLVVGFAHAMLTSRTNQGARLSPNQSAKNFRNKLNDKKYNPQATVSHLMKSKLADIQRKRTALITGVPTRGLNPIAKIERLRIANQPASQFGSAYASARGSQITSRRNSNVSDSANEGGGWIFERGDEQHAW